MVLLGYSKAKLRIYIYITLNWPDLLKQQINFRNKHVNVFDFSLIIYQNYFYLLILYLFLMH